MKNYEHTLVARQDVSATQLNQIKEKYTKLVEKNKGKVLLTQNWGLLNLSYIIKKNKKGNYIHFKIKADGNTIKDLEKNERIDKNLLKYLTVKVKNHDLETNYFAKKEGYEEIEKKTRNNRKEAK
tara:strand:- start:544 stop:918 length:375 start_codon:yes stop_codon:yes gene_type:complete